MKNFIYSILTVLAGCTLTAQENLGKKATLLEDGTISVETVQLPDEYRTNNRQQADLLFSFGEPANPAIKNSRGVTLADLDNDGIDEILYGIDTELYALKGDGTILWQKTVLGPILLPPTVMDIDGDDIVEIAVNTGYPTTVGRIYLMDNLGTDLPGWPLNFNDKWMINAPVFADLDGDEVLDILSCQRESSTVGFVHALKQDGTPINTNWPVQFDATPAFTPSVGDVDNDGVNDVVIATSSTGLYVYDANGNLHPGFPFVDPNVRYSYQSPILVDLDDNETLEIVGSNHGDAPGFYVLKNDATYYPGWPIATAGWTYSPPTVVDIEEDGTYEIFMADRNTSNDGTPLPTIYGLNPDGNDLPNFPIEKYGGNEGVLTIADINNDNVYDIIFSSTLTDMDGFGYIHAYSLDGSGELDGFPLRPRGFTFLNGAVLGDVDNDGLMDLTANSYTQTFGAGVDSTFVNTYNLNVPFDADKILRNGYKGDNSRDGLVKEEEILGVTGNTLSNTVSIVPNPSSGILQLQSSSTLNNVTMNVLTMDGKIVFSEKIDLSDTEAKHYDFSSIASGMYFISIEEGKNKTILKWLKQ
ncbi:T9SS type A sorting domain-containing protein [Marinirhabdus gelatinilytica]|uniref:Putative secreted protein (Por secretion system target) n=1 Tax=Marinirhabdus gelatinilytica TaxID=1703343 RepID=A0A370Q3R7_9FLAO|nr:T9SS type A sorting domain-containing protein [Marinirhabdus gelatinilytica]RDK82959.1 putative secreted protein (Por secretion system target) [Marinirhabdus gelatinilytica]